MDPHTPNRSTRSLKDQRGNVNELLKSLRSPNSTQNSQASRTTLSLHSSSAHQGRSFSNESPQSYAAIPEPIEHSSFNSPHQTRRQPSRAPESHRMSMYASQGELTYQRDAEKQLMQTMNTAKKDLRGDVSLVLLNRVVVQSISLYNTATDQEQLEEIDALCVMLSDYIKQYAESQTELLQPPNFSSSRVLNAPSSPLHHVMPQPSMHNMQQPAQQAPIYERQYHHKFEDGRNSRSSRYDDPRDKARFDDLNEEDDEIRPLSRALSQHSHVRPRSRFEDRDNTPAVTLVSHQSSHQLDHQSNHQSNHSVSTHSSIQPPMPRTPATVPVSSTLSSTVPASATSASANRSQSRMQQVIEKLRRQN